MSAEHIQNSVNDLMAYLTKNLQDAKAPVRQSPQLWCKAWFAARLARGAVDYNRYAQSRRQRWRWAATKMDGTGRYRELRRHQNCVACFEVRDNLGHA